MSNFYCDTCKRSLYNNNDWQFHLKGKTHLAKVVEHKSKTETSTSVSIAGLPGNYDLEDVKALFTKFGPIHSTSKAGNRLVVRFQDADSVRQAFKNKTEYKGRMLRVNKWVPQSEYKKSFGGKGTISASPVNKDPVLSQEKLQEFLDSDKTLEEQIEDLVKNTSLTPDDMDKRARVFRTIEQRLRAMLHPGCNVYPFGSSLTGLGMKGCDLDLFVDMPADFARQPWNRHSASLIPNVPVVNGEKPILAKISRSLRSHPEFTDIVFIPARVPIVKFFHRPTAIAGDINAHNSLGWHNSRLLRHLTTIDLRVKPLLLLVRLWSKQFVISGGNLSNKLSSYAWNMLVVFFLQKLEPPVLPTIRELQNAVADTDKQYVEDKLVSFSTHHSFNSSVNKQSITDLLRSFFRFFLDLDFASHVISPLLGKLIPRSEYPSAFNNTLKLKSALCVQDPIDLCHNVTSSFQDVHFSHLIGCCQAAAKIFDLVLEDKNPFWVLFHPPSCVPEEVPQLKKTGAVPCFWSVISPNLQQSVTEASAEVFERLSKLVREYFVVGLAFDVEEESTSESMSDSNGVEEPSPAKRRRVEPAIASKNEAHGSSSNPGSVSEKPLILLATAQTWRGRKEARETCSKSRPQDSMPMDYLSSEGLVSRYLKTNDSVGRQTLLRLSLQIGIETGRLNVNVGCIDGSSISSFSEFLRKDFAESIRRASDTIQSVSIECGKFPRK